MYQDKSEQNFVNHETQRKQWLEQTQRVVFMSLERIFFFLLPVHKQVIYEMQAIREKKTNKNSFLFDLAKYSVCLLEEGDNQGSIRKELSIWHWHTVDIRPLFIFTGRMRTDCFFVFFFYFINVQKKIHPNNWRYCAMPLLALWNHKQFVMMKLLTVPEREGKQGELHRRPIDWHSLILSTRLSRG